MFSRTFSFFHISVQQLWLHWENVQVMSMTPIIEKKIFSMQLGDQYFRVRDVNAFGTPCK